MDEKELPFVLDTKELKERVFPNLGMNRIREIIKPYNRGREGGKILVNKYEILEALKKGEIDF